MMLENVLIPFPLHSSFPSTSQWRDYVFYIIYFGLLEFSCSVMSDPLWPHGLQHARLLYPPLSARVCSISCPLKLAMPSNHLILCCPLLLLPSVFPSIGVFSNEAALCILFMDRTFRIVSKKPFSFFFLLQHLLYCSGLEWNPNLFLTQHAPSFLLCFIPEVLWFSFFI